jgi:hypothetical protein
MLGYCTQSLHINYPLLNFRCSEKATKLEKQILFVVENDNFLICFEFTSEIFFLFLWPFHNILPLETTPLLQRYPTK